jgi:hypothetical protein
MIAFVLLVVVSSCTHETKEPDPVPCPYNSDYEEMKDWYYFKEGTYWVYEEENSGNIDTILVVQSTEQPDEFFEWWGESSFDNYNYIYYYDYTETINCLTQENCSCSKIYRAKAMSGDYVGASGIFLYPHISNNYIHTVGTPNGQLSAGLSVLVNSSYAIELFDDSLIYGCRWEVSVDSSNSGFPVNYVIGYKIGIVRIEYPLQGETWVLKEMNIIQ